MDLYEALKAGTSKEELEKTFQKELADAIERVDKEAADTTVLNERRDTLVNAILDYINTLLDLPPETYEEFEAEFEMITSLLKSFEEGLKEDPLLNYTKDNKTYKIKKSDEDLEIINNFIKTFLKH